MKVNFNILMICWGMTAIMSASAQSRKPTRHLSPVSVRTASTGQEQPVADGMTLKRFTAVIAKQNAPDISYKGYVTTENIQNGRSQSSTERFILERLGKEYYYKIGNTELINQKVACLMVDHKLKKVFVMPPRLEQVPTLPDQAKLEALVGDMGYLISEHKDAKETKILFRNEQHDTCKEYGIRFESESQRLLSLWFRTPDPYHPGDKSWEVKNTIVFETSTNHAGLDRYTHLNDVVKIGKGKNITLTSRYHNYHLITL